MYIDPQVIDTTQQAIAITTRTAWWNQPITQTVLTLLGITVTALVSWRVVKHQIQNDRVKTAKHKFTELYSELVSVMNRYGTACQTISLKTSLDKKVELTVEKAELINILHGDIHKTLSLIEFEILSLKACGIKTQFIEIIMRKIRYEFNSISNESGKLSATHGSIQSIINKHEPSIKKWYLENTH